MNGAQPNEDTVLIQNWWKSFFKQGGKPGNYYNNVLGYISLYIMELATALQNLG